MDPDRALVAASFQEFNCPKNGHMTAQAWREMRDNPVDAQRLALMVVFSGPVWFELPWFKMNDLLKAMNLELIPSFDNGFFPRILF